MYRNRPFYSRHISSFCQHAANLVSRILCKHVKHGITSHKEPPQLVIGPFYQAWYKFRRYKGVRPITRQGETKRDGWNAF